MHVFLRNSECDEVNKLYNMRICSQIHMPTCNQLKVNVFPRKGATSKR